MREEGEREERGRPRYVAAMGQPPWLDPQFPVSDQEVAVVQVGSMEEEAELG